MIHIPNEPSPGEPMSANWGKQVVRCLRALTPRESPTVRPNTNTGGTFYDVKQAGGGTRTTPKLFEMSDASVTVSDVWTAQIRVTSSVLGDTVPAFPDALVAFSSGDIPLCIFQPTTSTGSLWAHIEIDSAGAVITRELAFGETMPTADATHGYLQIGTWSITDHVLTPHNDAYGPIAVSICRNWFAFPATYGITLTGSAA